MEAAERLDAIALKIKQVVLDLEKYKAENARLSNENEKLKDAMGQMRREAIGPLEHSKEDTRRLLDDRQGMNDSEQVAAWKARMDQYIQEIDKCIEWLQRQ